MGSFLEAFRARAGEGDTLRFDRFVEIALYDPQAGYYRSERTRVGKGPGTDFTTAAAISPLFGELIAAAAVQLLGSRAAAGHDFIEIGPETPGGVLAGETAPPFASVRTVRLGEEPALTGRCVVFSNELFDAQPFRRFIFREGRWRELGVRTRGEALEEVEVPSDLPRFLPPQAPEGHRLDAPTGSVALIDRLCHPGWEGLFLACDYGKSWPELAGGTPGGTARAYRLHRQSTDLLAYPGEQDLTCHVCWDWLIQSLQAQGFVDPGLESQEAFFVRHAGARLAEISAAEAGRFSERKQALLSLIHPAHFGRRFQVLHALRP